MTRHVISSRTGPMSRPDRIRRLGVWVIVVMLAMTAATAGAGIVGSSGAVTVLGAAPFDVRPGGIESDTQIFAFSEQQSVSLRSNLNVDIDVPGTYASAASLPGGVISAGTWIDSHFIHMDPVTGGAPPLSGTVTFAGRILGVIVLGQTLGATLDDSDDLGGGTWYPRVLSRRGLDWDPPPAPQEVITWNPADPYTIGVTLFASNVVDQVRVITEGSPGGYHLTFSVDIGSDKELSDPLADGDEGMDPGDAYSTATASFTPPMVPCGADGILDDAVIFGYDPVPSAPDCTMPRTSVVPVGTCLPACYPNYFDLDAHDEIDIDLQGLIPLPGPLLTPLLRSALPASGCIYPPEYLLVSFDDDQAAGWPVADVPVLVPSPLGVNSYGTTTGRDEVVGLNLSFAAIPFTVTSQYPWASEQDLHSDLAPNPDAVQADDDDVDSINMLIDEPGGIGCPFWYFSADHEANNFPALDPGSIYLVTGAGPPVQIIDDVTHLGLPESTDIDAFEFAWLPHPGAGQDALAVLFSVDEDDPLTAAVESGGRNPRMIYGSFLNGAHFALFPGSYTVNLDDIDALTISRENPIQCHCPADVNADGTVNGLDASEFLDCLLMGGSLADCVCADMDGSGSVDMADVSLFVAALLSPPC